MAEEIFDVGDEVTLQVEIKDPDGALADPTEVKFWVLPPESDTQEAIEDGDVTHVSLGVYKTLYFPDTPGEWFWRVETSGEITQTADGTFFVRRPAMKGSGEGPVLAKARLSPLALCAVEEVVDLLGLDPDQAAEREQTIIRAINAASRAIPRRAQRDFLVVVTEEEPTQTRWQRVESADVRRGYVRVGDMKEIPVLVTLVSPDRDLESDYEDTDFYVTPDVPDYGWPYEFINFKSTAVNSLSLGWWLKVQAEWGFPILPDDIRQIAIGTAAKWVANDVMKMTELARQQGRSVRMTNLIPEEFLDTVDEFRTFRVA